MVNIGTLNSKMTTLCVQTYFNKQQIFLKIDASIIQYYHLLCFCNTLQHLAVVTGSCGTDITILFIHVRVIIIHCEIISNYLLYSSPFVIIYLVSFCIVEFHMYRHIYPAGIDCS